MKTIVIYYSYTNNTKGIAAKVASSLNADIEGIVPVKPYVGEYEKVVDDAKKEVKRGLKRPIKPLKHNLNDYDRIIIGTPAWWYKMSSPMLTFLSENRFDGKIVVPFITHDGKPGTVIDDMTEIAKNKGADVRDSHIIEFITHDDGTPNGIATPAKEIEDWIESLKSMQ